MTDKRELAEKILRNWPDLKGENSEDDYFELAKAHLNLLDTGWVSVETSHKDGTSILGYIPAWNTVSEVWFDEDRWWMPVREHGRMGCPAPSHCMPLPPTPHKEG